MECASATARDRRPVGCVRAHDGRRRPTLHDWETVPVLRRARLCPAPASDSCPDTRPVHLSAERVEFEQENRDIRGPVRTRTAFGTKRLPSRKGQRPGCRDASYKWSLPRLNPKLDLAETSISAFDP